MQHFMPDCGDIDDFFSLDEDVEETKNNEICVDENEEDSDDGGSSSDDN